MGATRRTQEFESDVWRWQCLSLKLSEVWSCLFLLNSVWISRYWWSQQILSVLATWPVLRGAGIVCCGNWSKWWSKFHRFSCSQLKPPPWGKPSVGHASISIRIVDLSKYNVVLSFVKSEFTEISWIYHEIYGFTKIHQHTTIGPWKICIPSHGTGWLSTNEIIRE